MRLIIEKIVTFNLQFSDSLHFSFLIATLKRLVFIASLLFNKLCAHLLNKNQLLGNKIDTTIEKYSFPKNEILYVCLLAIVQRGNGNAPLSVS